MARARRLWPPLRRRSTTDSEDEYHQGDYSDDGESGDNAPSDSDQYNEEEKAYLKALETPGLDGPNGDSDEDDDNDDGGGDDSDDDEPVNPRPLKRRRLRA